MEHSLTKNKGMLVLLAVWIVLQMIQLDGEWARMDDDAHYILHAHSLVTHHRYNDPNFVHMDEAHFVPKNTLPGWPLLLTPVLLLFGKNLIVLKSIVLLIAMGTGFFIYRIFERQWQDKRLSQLLTGIYLFSMTTIVYSRLIYSEWPYMLVSFLVMAIFVGQDEKKVTSWKLFAIGFCLGMMLLFRSVAAAMVLAVLAVIVQDQIVKRRKYPEAGRRTVIIILTAVAVYLAVQFVVRPEKGAGYKEQFLSKELYYPADGRASAADIVKRIPENGKSFIRHIVPMLAGRSWHEFVEYKIPGASRWVNRFLVIFGATVVFLMLSGFIKQSIREPSVLEYYTFFYLAVMSIVWFHTEPYRYMMPIAPLLLYYLVAGMEWLINRLTGESSKSRSVLIGILLALLLINGMQAVVEIYRYRFSPQNARATSVPYKGTVNWLKEHAETDEMIIADDSRWYALEVEKPVTTFLSSRNKEKAYRYITEFPRAIIVYDEKRPLQRICLLPVLQEFSDRFHLVKSFDHIHIYQYPPEERERGAT